MKMKILSHILGCILFLSCHNSIDERGQKDVAITRQPQIGYNQIKDIVEDKQGYIWIGTPGGVYQYNGKRYYHYRSTEDTTSLCNDAVLKMYCSSRGQLFVLTEFGTSVYNNDGSFQTIFKEGVYPYSNGITETSDGRIFLSISDVGTNIYEYDARNKICTKRLSGFLPLADRNDNLWIWRDGEACCHSIKDFSLIKSIRIDDLSDVAGLLPNGDLFYHTSQGIFIIDPNTFRRVINDSIERVSMVLKNKHIKRVTPYNSSSMLLYAKNNQLYLWDTVKMTIIDQNHTDFPFHIPLDDISTVYVDSHQNVWIGSERDGYQVLYHQQSRFKKETETIEFFRNKDITNIFRGTNNDYYIIVSHSELYHVLADQRIFRLDISSFISKEEIDQCFVDSENLLWLVTNRNLIKCKVYDENEIESLKIYPYYCYTVGEDGTGNIWFESNHNLYYLSKGAETPVAIKENIGIVNTIRKIDSNSIIVSTYAGNIYIVDSNKMTIEEIEIPRSRSTGIVCMDLMIDHTGNAWGVSYGQGLMHIDLTSKKISFYNDTNICGQMCSVIEDCQQNIWIGTLHGLIRFDTANKRFISYYKEDGIMNDSYVPMCAIHGQGDELIFGGTKGLTLFDPKEIKPYETCKIKIEYISSNEQLLKPYEHKRVKMQGDSIAQVCLTNNNSGVYFYYTTLDYGNLNKYKTEFYLEGLDQQWHSLENEDYAYYSHIPAGHYVLQIRAINENGDVIDAKTVDVFVEPAPWAQKWLLFGVYPLCLLICLYTGWRIYRRIRQNRDQIRKITVQREQEKYANMMNIKYFTNISHEFRTPLTMIYGAFRTLEENPKDSLSSSSLFQVIRHNTERMLKLINQLLDFNKMENGILRLKVSKTNVIPLFNACADRFIVGFQQKKINVRRSIQSETINLLLDDDKFDKILTNILSNALKYSPEEGSISIGIQVITQDIAHAEFPMSMKVKSDEWLEIKVADTGIGIPEDKQKAVFERFYQIEHPDYQSGWGTGIGLFYAKSLVELHHGFIKCSSNAPNGSVFTFIIPMNPALYDNNQQVDSPKGSNAITKIQENVREELNLISPPYQPDDDQAAKILAVDDDTEILNFMKLLLKDYVVECRTNPNTTIGEIGDIKPDLIISDILMHGMNGYEFCHKIKSDATTCHLPVILLTAQSSSEHQVQGLSAGADAYVVKPFEPRYLTALIKSTLLNREKIRKVLTSSTQIDIQEQPILQSQDGIFMEKLYSYMESHLSEAEIDLGEILNIFSISRSKFYYKVKDLTGLSPNSFFRTYKLNRAAQMIKEGNEKLTYIADVTGFCSQSYFTASFKKQFGCSPSKYKEEY